MLYVIQRSINEYFWTNNSQFDAKIYRNWKHCASSRCAGATIGVSSDCVTIESFSEWVLEQENVDANISKTIFFSDEAEFKFLGYVEERVLTNTLPIKYLDLIKQFVKTVKIEYTCTIWALSCQKEKTKDSIFDGPQKWELLGAQVFDEKMTIFLRNWNDY